MMLAHGEVGLANVLLMILIIAGGIAVASLLAAIFARRGSVWWLVLAVSAVFIGGSFSFLMYFIAGSSVPLWAHIFYNLPLALGLFSLMRWRRKKHSG